MVEETHAPRRISLLVFYVVRDVFPDADLLTHRERLVLFVTARNRLRRRWRVDHRRISRRDGGYRGRRR